MLSGLVVGDGENKIPNATVVLNIGGKEYVKNTDKYGRFFIVNLLPEDGIVVVSKGGYSNEYWNFTIKAAETTNLTIKLVGRSI